MRFRDRLTGRIVDLNEDYAKVFGDHYVRVDKDAPLTEEPCCGEEVDDTKKKISKEKK